MFLRVSSTRFAPASPASTSAAGTDNRPLASSVTRSRRSSAMSMLTRYPAASGCPVTAGSGAASPGWVRGAGFALAETASVV